LFDKLSDYQLFKEYPATWSKYGVYNVTLTGELRKVHNDELGS